MFPTNIPDSTGGQHGEECKVIHSYLLVQRKVHMGQGPHIKCYTVKLVEEKLGKSIEHIGTGKNFLSRTPVAYALRSRINKCDLIKLQSFCKVMDSVNRTKQQPTD